MFSVRRRLQPLEIQAVLVAAVAMLATFPGRTHGLGIVTERLLRDDHLSLTRQGFGDLNFWATLLGAAFCLPCGGLFDRLGVRRLLPAVVALLALAVWGMTVASNLPLFFLALLLTRGFGQSALSVVSIAHVGNWFGSRQGLAMGIYSVLVSLGYGLTFRLTRDFQKDT
jgi:nitrate/nitrite transporter NarK